MATRGRKNPPKNQMSIASVKSTVTAYFVPSLFLAAALFFQLVVLPRSFPPSHYDVLGIPKYSPTDEVAQAYEKIKAKWDSSDEIPPTVDFIKVRYAFELLTNALLRRDYDIYNIDEYSHVLEKAKEQQSGRRISEIDLPLIKAANIDPADQNLNLINSENFLSMFEDDKPLLLQIISLGSSHCAQFSATWQRTVNMLKGIANTGVVELGDAKLAVHLAEKKSTGQPFFRKGLPALMAFPPECKSMSCLYRYDGELSVDGITEWLAGSILNLPRIPYYSKESLVPNFLVKTKPHLVKVIFISKTGERATPFIRQAAKNYSSYATFAFALWQEEDSSFWWNMFGVDSAPAMVFMKDPGVEPVVYQGSVNSSMFTDIMEKNKHHVLPQLRNLTSMELGCDVNGYSRAGKDTKIWYCAIVTGRPSQELNQMRATMRRVQEKLSNDGKIDMVNEDASAPAVLALQQKRLTFAWLDGEAQSRYCFFHIHSEDSFETCGTRRGITDVARLFIVRYERKISDDKLDTPKKQENNIFSDWYHSEPDPVSTLVAKYNGSNEIPEIVQWISQIIKDGDTREIPHFKTKAPELLPEDANQLWSKSSKNFAFSGVLRSGFLTRMYDYRDDPRIGPSLLLVALMSSGLIWMNRSRSTQSTKLNESIQKKHEDNKSQQRRRRPREGANQLVPPSITDLEPKNSQQIELSDSDEE